MAKREGRAGEGKIFVCYRRDDSAGHAGRLYDRLNNRFPGRVFMDVAGINVGNRWAEVIESTLRSCKVAIILIGKHWLDQGAEGVRRIDQPNDPIRAEITTALRLNLKIVPLLVSGAAVPERRDLPSDLASVAEWQALRIDDDDFDHDSTRLIRALERELGDAVDDPHLENADKKHAELRRLMNDAEAAISRADWITAKQLLQSVLAIDRGHGEAAGRLRFVTEQSRQSYKDTTSTQKSHAGRWIAVGAVAVFVLLILAGVIVSMIEQRSSTVSQSPVDYSRDTDPQPRSPIERVNDPEPPAPAPTRPDPKRDDSPDILGRQGTESEPPPASPQPTLAGDYALASYTEQGVAIPANGGMRLTPDGSGNFHFQTYVNVPGASFSYVGIMRRAGSYWTTTTFQTNDPRAVSTPIATQLQFDGSRLITQNQYGQAAVWIKQ